MKKRRKIKRTLKGAALAAGFVAVFLGVCLIDSGSLPLPVALIITSAGLLISFAMANEFS